jgi:hypothetical protein
MAEVLADKLDFAEKLMSPNYIYVLSTCTIFIGLLIVSSGPVNLVNQSPPLNPEQIEAYKTNFPKVAGILEAPGARPFIGHLSFLGGRKKKNDATIFSEWGTHLCSGIFQIKFGNQRHIIVGTWAVMKDLWVARNTSLLDRPHHKDFVDKIGVDISGSPMNDQIRRCRTAALVSLIPAKPTTGAIY